MNNSGKIQLHDLSKSFADKTVLRNINLEILAGEFISVIGPSGVGKTTLLRILAGLEIGDNTAPEFYPSTADWDPVLMVFQDFMLFPHVSVQDNIAFGLKTPEHYRRVFPEAGAESRKQKNTRIQAEVSKLLSIFGLEGLGRQYPATLSAGQKQRVALARALAIQPKLLLLDEPFANLDQNLKMDTALFLRKIQKQTGVTTLAVTHDQHEAFAMSDRIAVMLEGRLLQLCDVETLYRYPVSPEVGAFLGPVNIIEPEKFKQFKIAAENSRTSPSGPILVRAEAIELKKDPGGPGRVRNRSFLGTLIQVEVELEDTILYAYLLSCSLDPGDRVQLTIREFVPLTEST